MPVLAVLLMSFPAQAQDSARTEHLEYRLLPGAVTAGPGEAVPVGIRLDIAPHWHTYWRNPGDSGLAIRTTWDFPDGFELSEEKWPVPDKIYEGPLANYGYETEATLIQTLRLPQSLPEGPIDLPLKIDVLVCKDICIPESASLTLRLNDPERVQTDGDAVLQGAQAALPHTVEGHYTFHRTEKDGQKLFSLMLTPDDPAALERIAEETAEFFPYEWGVLDYPASPDVRIENGVLSLTHETSGERDLAELETVDGVLVYRDAQGQKQGFEVKARPAEDITGTKAAEKTGEKTGAEENVQARNIASSAASAPMGLALAVLLAIAGGLVLNLMPCVFPVLSIKALSLVKMTEKHPDIAKAHGLAYTGGVILSFLAIGAALLILKQAGSAIGWGFQLQNPVAVGLLAYLLFLIGLNLMGVFEFGGRLANLGGGLTQKGGPAGSFFTGVLATIVATPCTAPFMGAALGFAIVQPAVIAMSVFAALGLGLALPYLILSFVPAFRKILPRPGAWMDTFKQFLAFPMFASAIWLVWVISQQSGPEGVQVTLLGMLSFALALWLARRAPGNMAAKNILRLFIVFFVLFPVVTLAYMKTKAEDVACAIKTYTFGEQFSPGRLALALEGDQPVFVEMTAAWCITCKANHIAAIDTDSTRTLFETHNVTYLIGDWTNSNAEITEYLSRYGRSGVPLYVYYGPRDPATGKRPEPKLLPQVLTTAIVTRAVEGKL